METGVETSSMECDLELNRGLCSSLLQRLSAALKHLDALPEESPLPVWIDRLFGGREGVVGAYIRLSQQQLRIAAMQVETGAKADAAEQMQSFTREDMTLVRMAIKRWEEQEKTTPAED